MSAVAELLPPTAVSSPSAAVGSETDRMYRWSIEDYERLGELGVLTPEDRVELVDGFIVNKELNHPPRAAAIDELTNFFGEINARRWWVRCQQSVRLPGQQSVPEPDLVLARRSPGGYRTQHPTPADIFLLVEVSNTSVAVDRGRKLTLYARAGVAEYWVVNVPERVVEVYRDP